jgi:hypothetical protein
LLEKIIPLLQYFSRYEVCWSTFEIREKRREYFSSTLPSGMENVTLIVDATPIPIQHRRNDAKQGDEGVWDGAHHMWGTIFH